MYRTLAAATVLRSACRLSRRTPFQPLTHTIHSHLHKSVVKRTTLTTYPRAHGFVVNTTATLTTMSTRRSSRAASKTVNYNDDKEVDETATAPEPPKRRQRSQSPAKQKKKPAAAERERSPAQDEEKSSTKADHEEKKEVAAEHEEQKDSEKQVAQESAKEQKSAESKDSSDSSSKSKHSAEDQDIIDRFWDEVNMDADELEEWLKTDESKQVGWSNDSSGESVGHRSGRTIVQILRKGKDNVTDDEIAHMRKVHSYLARHMAQGHRLKPENVEDSKWRKSLKNWGVDPVDGGSSIAKS